MIKKLRRSIEEMPRPAYIFLKNVLMLCCVILLCSLLLYLGAESNIADYDRLKLAALMLETPSSILIISLICFVIILDRS